MKEKPNALLVESRSKALGGLRLALQEQPIGISIARSCAEAAVALGSECPPHIVFSEIELSDGTWADVLALAAKAAAPVNVILVASFADVSFYVQAIERGAFDYIVPPLSEPELFHIVRTAAENALRRREHAMALPPTPPRGASARRF